MRRRGRGLSPKLFRRVVILVATVLSFYMVPSLPSATIPEGRVPDIQAKTVDGEDVRIEFSEDSSPVILTFWSIYCKSCSEELEKVQELVTKYGSDRVRVYAVNEDYDLNIERVSSFLANLEERIGKIIFTVLYDHEAEIFKSFSLLHLPTLIYINGDGEVREIIEGFDRGRQRAVISALTKLIEEVASEKLREIAEEKYYEMETVVPVCGVYRDGKWIRPVDDFREEKDASLERALSVSEYLSTREAIGNALQDAGIPIDNAGKDPSCIKPYGIESGIYMGEKDALDLFIETFTVRDFLRREENNVRGDGRNIKVYSVYRANLQKLRERVIEKGYSPRPSTYVLKFVNADFLSHSEFTEKLPRQVPLIGSVKTITKDGQVIEDELRCHIRDAEDLVEALRGVSLERLRISAIPLGGNVIEIQFVR